MARSKPVQLPTEPWYPTQVMRRVGDVVQSVSNDVWLYKSVPMTPVADARDDRDVRNAAAPLMAAFHELGAISSARAGRRVVDKPSYREFHTLLINVPGKFSAPREHSNAQYLQGSFGNVVVPRRHCLFGVSLKESLVAAGGLAGTIERVAHVISEGGIRLEDFEDDRKTIDAALTRSGLLSPSVQEFNLAESWWNGGNRADVPYMAHDDHLHFFATPHAASTASRLYQSNPDCSTWPTIEGEHTVAFSSVATFDIGYVDAVKPFAQWVSRLVSSGALAVSVRGKVEPAKVTRNELRRHKRNYEQDIADRFSQGKMTRAEQEEMLGQLSDVESEYATGGTPTLVDVTVTMALTGRDERTGFDPREIGEYAGLHMVPMTYRQQTALVDTMLASRIRANPHMHDIPCQTLAYSGLASLSIVGSAPSGALVGFTERDRQPAWLSQTGAYDADTTPYFAVFGASGSGKSMFMLWAADQFARTYNDKGEKTPVVLLDLSPDSDLSKAVKRSGGTIASLDNLMSSDGIFDPLRFASQAQVGVEMAHGLLMSINPFGDEVTRMQYETPLMEALSEGVARGATCIGQALELAAEHINSPVIAQILARVKQASSVPSFRAVCGFNPEGSPLRVAEGITYIRLGAAHLDLPESTVSNDRLTFTQRVSVALVQAMVFGAIMACAMRQGVVMFDEAHIFMGVGKAKMDMVGRTARKQQVLPVILTQKATDATRAGLTGAISQGMVLPIEDPDEAAAALEIFRLAPTPDRLARITAKAEVGGAGGKAPDWSSMRALRDPVTDEVLRGTVGIYFDLYKRAVPVEIVIPREFLADGSTRRKDMLGRDLEHTQQPQHVIPPTETENAQDGAFAW